MNGSQPTGRGIEIFQIFFLIQIFTITTNHFMIIRQIFIRVVLDVKKSNDVRTWLLKCVGIIALAPDT